MKYALYLILVLFSFTNCVSQEPVKTITTSELKALLEKGNIQLLDVRTPKEIKQGFIKTAKFLNYFDDDFAIKATQLLDKNKVVYIYCRSGNRSGKSAKILKEKGYNVYNVLGGYNQWKKEN